MIAAAMTQETNTRPTPGTLRGALRCANVQAPERASPVIRPGNRGALGGAPGGPSETPRNVPPQPLGGPA
eukprot:399579-Alexandrium_andersonii.AAC.1